MSAPAAPTIPPRPVRSHDTPPLRTSPELPKVPPRPASRTKRLDRSVSPSNFPRSPFNETPYSSSLGRSISNEQSNTSLPPRPPSVTLPSLGQEGSEYADIVNYANPTSNESDQAPATQTRNVGADLPMHAPKPSLSRSGARAQVEAVTRTDSNTAAALGIGKATTPTQEESDRLSRTLHSKTSSARPDSSSVSTERRLSIQYGEDTGIPEIGMRVPINPYLGDVQAPSPASFSQHPPSSSHSAQQRGKHHTRTRSGREVFLPPGSYGLHGHGAPPADQFEKAWYEKHPEALQDEHGQYKAIGSGRGEWALSSDDLNKLVRETAKSAGPSAYPDEQIGYMATDKYSSRIASPAIQTPSSHHASQTSGSEPPFQSPLRKSFSAEVREAAADSHDSLDKIPETETIVNEKGEAIHIDPPSRRASRVGGGSERDTEDLGPNGGNTEEEGGWIDEQGYGAPILASDEISKGAGAEFMQPAVSPHRERRDSSYHVNDIDTPGYVSGSRTPTSRPGSRPSSVHGVLPNLSRFTSRLDEREDIHTPLEDVEEYEPLFPEEDEDGKKKPLTAADRFKARPDTLKRRFPSQDIWEDTPTSLMHVTTVSTPDLAQEPAPSTSSKTFETPETERARKGEVNEAEKKQLMPKEERLAKSIFAPHLRDDMPTRPGMQQRFPSRDIWEDSPDSLHLVTTVQTPPTEDAKSPPETTAPKPPIPPRPTKLKVAEKAAEPSVPPAQPPMPVRPAKRLNQVPPLEPKQLSTTETQVSPTEGRKGPIIPDRPKPQVRSRSARAEPSETTSNLTKTVSATSAGSSGSTEAPKDVTSPPLPKAKPTIPARPAGSKIAQLQAGFISDLNKRLQVGPKPVEKEKEPEAEMGKNPLSDARKGRARGPQRRKPAPSPATEATTAVPSVQFSIATAWSVFEIGDDGNLAVHDSAVTPVPVKENVPAALPPAKTTEPAAADTREPTEASAPPPNIMAPPLSTNNAGEPTDPPVHPDSSIEHPARDDTSASPSQPRKEEVEPALEATSKVSSKNSERTQTDPEPDAAPMYRDEPPATEEITGAGDTVKTTGEEISESIQPSEPSSETLPKNVSDKDLEEMTTLADGKAHAEEEKEALRQEAASH